MVGHVGKTSHPIVGVVVSVSPPCVAIGATAAPLTAGDVVIEVDVDLLSVQLLNDSVEDFQPLCLGSELRVVPEDLLQHFGSECLTDSIVQCLLQGHVVTVIVVNLVDHLNGVGQADDVHAKALDIVDDLLNGLVLQTFGNHGIVVARPICTGNFDDATGAIDHVWAICGEGKVGKGFGQT